MMQWLNPYTTVFLFSVIIIIFQEEKVDFLQVLHRPCLRRIPLSQVIFQQPSIRSINLIFDALIEKLTEQEQTGQIFIYVSNLM